MLIMVRPFLILSTRSCKSYAEKVVEALKSNPEHLLFPQGFDYTGELSVLSFSDGELEVTLHRSVRGKTVFLFTSAARNPGNLPVELCKLELYHTIDVLKRSQAAEIIVFEPYISCSRSDRTTRRNSVGLWIHYKTLISLGVDHLITYQLHSDKSKTMFDPCICSIDDVQTLSLLQKYLCDTSIPSHRDLVEKVRENWLFCSVDAGGEKLARKFAESFGTQLVIAHKQRSTTKANTVECINLLSAVPFEGKEIWIVDDMIDTGGSIYNLARELSSKSGKPVNIMIVHPVFSPPAIDRITELKNDGVLARLVVCDTIDTHDIAPRIDFIEVIGSADLSARITLGISQNRQMADLIDVFSPEEYLLSREESKRRH